MTFSLFPILRGVACTAEHHTATQLIANANFYQYLYECVTTSFCSKGSAVGSCGTTITVNERGECVRLCCPSTIKR